MTGYPEGCPLACVATAALVPRVLLVSYVDNLELVCDRLVDPLHASEAQDQFCSMLDLQIDRPRHMLGLPHPPDVLTSGNMAFLCL